MADYKETNITGKKWNRCNQIIIYNHRGSTPSLDFVEEEVFQLSETDEMKKSIGVIHDKFDPQKTFKLVDPTTLEPTTQIMSYGEVYVILLSAYLSLARARDNG